VQNSLIKSLFAKLYTRKKKKDLSAQKLIGCSDSHTFG